MSTPILSLATSRCWLADRDPTSSESVNLENYNFWQNTVSNDLFTCLNSTPSAMVFQKLVPTSGLKDFPTLPVISGSVSSGTATYSVQVGKYEKMSNQVFILINLTWSGHTGTGNMLVSNIPFNCADLTQVSSLSLQSVVLPLGSFSLVAVTNVTNLKIMSEIAASTRVPVLMSSSGSLNLLMRYMV